MSDLKQRAEAAVLAAADWYVNSQVKFDKPCWDANHGRFIYTYHMPSKQVVLGISWTQGRAIMVLLGAYELTGDQKYLTAARLGGEYIRNLQILDARDTRCYGAIREGCPGRVVRVDAQGTPDEVFARVWAAVADLFPEAGGAAG